MTSSIHSLKRIGATAGLGLSLILSCAPGSTATAADRPDPIQREDLALIDAQLARVDRVIDRMAKRQRDEPRRRVILDIARLRSDIHDIRSGIHAYLAPPRLQARQPAPLSGDYLEQTNDHP